MTLTNAKVLMAAAVVAAAGAVAGCGGDEDDRPWRNPGGFGGNGGNTGGNPDGGGGLGDGGIDDGGGGTDGTGTETDGGGSNDAGPMDTDGGVMSLTGQVCVVSDLRQPDACPAVASRIGVTVQVRGTADMAVSGADGRFELAATGAVVLELGALGLERSVVPAAPATPLVNAPVISSQDWQAVLDAIAQVQPDDAGAIVLYVEDAGGAAVSGATMDPIAGSTVVPHYDDGGALAWRTAGGTGAQGVVLFLDVSPGTVTLDGVAPGPRPVTLAGVPVVADTITFVRVRLAAP